ncbi:MAG: hypothetical protein JO091_12865 [Acidobacteriaceae bacterium]|nr:hypothetical protein [Acidobacteriaceae bacterium]
MLHRLLLERARDLDISLQWEVKGLQVTDGSLHLGEERLRPKLIVAADGQHSRIRRAAGLNNLRYERLRYGFRRHYKIAPWSRYMELHWGERSQLYVTPISEGEVGIALLSADPKLRLASALEEFPQVRARLDGAEPSSAQMGAITAMRSFRRVSRAHLALIGDASGSVDAITGEGICLAFRQALALADAFHAGDLEQYNQAHQQLRRRPAGMAWLLLELARHKSLRKRVLVSFAKQPHVFARFLALHIGEASLLDLCDWSLLNFGFDLLTA